MYETVIYEKTYIAVLFLYFLGNTHFCYNALEREGEKYGKILIYKGNNRKTKDKNSCPHGSYFSVVGRENFQGKCQVTRR